MAVLQSSINKLVHGLLSADELLFFDATWYAKQIPSSHWLKKHPFVHYIKYRNNSDVEYSVNPLFNPKWYKENHNIPDQQNAFQHYLQVGIKKNLSPHPLFNARWYKKHNSDVSQADWTAFHHYHACGIQEARSPHPLFDARWYREQQAQQNQQQEKNTLLQFLSSDNSISPHVLFDNQFFIAEAAKQGIAIEGVPLLYYLENSLTWSIKPHPLFDPAYYQQQVAGGLTVPPLLHYLLEGHRQYNPHPLFDTTLYLAQHPKLQDEASIPPLTHFLLQERQSNLLTHLLFNNKWYIEQLDPETQETITNPLLHFLNTTNKEHYSPHPLFDPAYFAMQAGLDDNISSSDLLIEHYIKEPANWELATDPLFNPQWYKSHYHVTNGNKPLLEHFLSTGQHIDASPHLLFDASWYEERNADVTEANLDKFSHYVQRGYKEERTPHPLFDPTYYQQQVEEQLTEADIKKNVNPLKHFLASTDHFLNPHPLFDVAYFLNKAKEKGITIKGNPLICYLDDKQLWQIPTHPLFSPIHYQSQKRAHNSQAPLLDYIKYGSHLYDPHPLFDTSWYFTLYPKLQESKTTTPLSHYLRIGIRGAVSPHPLFNPSFYLRQLNKDEQYVGAKNPLVHFLTNKKTLNPHPLFDSAYFLHNAKNTGFTVTENPLSFFLTNKALWNTASHPLFDAVYYQKQTNKTLTSPAVIHYLLEGHHKHNPHLLFDSRWYLEQFTLEQRKKIKDPLLHFINKKNKSTLSPHPLFDPIYFALQAEITEPLSASDILIDHYLQQPTNWSLATDPLFNPNWYKELHGISDVTQPLLMHFLLIGQHTKTSPHPLFDIDWYKERNHDVTEAHSDIFTHYVYFGYKSNRTPHPLFDSQYYQKQLEQLGVTESINPLKHFLSSTKDFLNPHPLFDVEYFLAQAKTKNVNVSGNPLISYLMNKELGAIATHPLFDPEYYQLQSQSATNHAPLIDYIKYGSHLYDPHPLFNNSWYFSRYPKLQDNPTTVPLSHYLHIGVRGGISPHPLFTPQYYLQQVDVSEKKLAVKSALIHFLKNKSNLLPHPLFDTSYFEQNLNNQGIYTTENLLSFFIKHKELWHIPTHPLFDANFYQEQANCSSLEPSLIHYLTEGHHLYNPHPLFDNRWYLEQFALKQRKKIKNPLLHFINKKNKKTLSPHPLFDCAYFTKQAGISPSLSASEVLINHYIKAPANWELATDPLFNPKWYKKQYLIDNVKKPLLLYFLASKNNDTTPHPLFDASWYEERNADVTEAHSNKFNHYVYFGYKSKRTPHPLFDSLYYQRQLKKIGIHKVINPLKHFLSCTDEFLNPHPLFDIEYFLSCAKTKGFTVTGNPLTCYVTNKELWQVPTHPLFAPEHYQSQNKFTPLHAPLLSYVKYNSHLYDPHPLFDTTWYFQFYPKLVKSQTTAPLSHYLRIGTRGGISPHPLFHPPFYLDQLNEHEKESAIKNPLMHFLSNTKTLSPHPLFDIAYFLQQLYIKDMNDDTPRSGAYVLLEEYLNNKENWHLNTHVLFDSNYYQTQISSPLTIAPLAHYMKLGSLKYNPHILFHTEWYLGRNRQVAEFKGAFGCPLFHFIEKSYSRGEMPHPYFHTRWYSDIYLNADRKEKNPLIHYLQEGAEKGFRPNPIFNIDWYVKKHQLPEHTNALIHFLKQAPLKPLPRVRNRISDCFATQMVGPVIKNPLAKRVPTLPLRSLIVLFTPRSGSSWLTTLLMQTKRMGQPGEWFNPDLIQSGSFGLGDSFPSIKEYSTAVQKAHQSINGVFGAEVAYPHLEDMIALADVKTLFSKPHFIFHYRRNIVAQAISLFMAVESGFFHSHQESNKKHLPDYNVVGIRKWVQEILDHEIGFAAFFREQGLTPYISSYEALVESQENTVKEIARDSKIILPADFSIEESPMKKISSGKNHEYEMRFRQEEDSYMQYVQSARPMFESELFT